MVLYVSQVPARPFYAIFVIAWYALFAISENVGVFIAAEILAPVALATIWAPGETGLVAAALLSAAGLAITDYRRRPVAASGAFAGFWIAYECWHIFAGYTPLLVLTAAYALFLGWPLWRALVRRETLRLHELAILTLNAGLYFAACIRAAARRVRALRRTLRRGARRSRRRLPRACFGGSTRGARSFPPAPRG